MQNTRVRELTKNEKTTFSDLNYFKNLLKIYPTGILSVVSDTFDLWSVLTKVIPTLKEEILSRISKRLNINKKEAKYFLSISSIENNMYKKEDDSIEIIYKDGSTRDIAKASDMLNISLLSRKVKKYYICYLRSENDGH